ncbi:hypothetical protein ACE1CI_19205 [Aerosakkonemataceae cyanobacterium BLCC-F50]|uniref:Uncharacterized protein n=1 Tax=Floridaenema flaviceps BLCC-F50 TaxID=3153642 RepID=A0ABV4XU06_9CYAN
MQNAGVTGAAQAAIATYTLSYLTLFGATDRLLRLSPSKPEVQVSLPLVLQIFNSYLLCDDSLDDFDYLLLIMPNKSLSPANISEFSLNFRFRPDKSPQILII